MRLRFPEARGRLKRAELLHHPPYASAVSKYTHQKSLSNKHDITNLPFLLINF
ncbi:unnamed protein product [Leptidea sinapis]|uniref:Uncharacterized protein n=1 Tax=Leptidea sinapis TaxID=189913 RepID=A0A5E4QAT7_9NEOP|nr:unnamed protein product [Leptidea sinapis]